MTDHDNPKQGWTDYGADRRVIYQLGNEANDPFDNGYWLDLMKTADGHGRRLIIFNDSVGWTEDNVWERRADCLAYAKAHGHLVGLHAYGDVTKGGTTWCPMSDTSSWRWYAGRFEHLYGLMTPNKQPDLILSECGAGGFQQNAGWSSNWLWDVRNVATRVADLPYLKAFNWWTMGGGGPFGFGRDSIDDYARLLNL